MAVSARFFPPANETPLQGDGTHSQAWAQYHTAVSDRLARLDANLGTTAGDNASAGQVGEYVETIVATPFGLVNVTVTLIASLTLQPGDWQVGGEVWFTIGTTAATGLQAGINPGAVSFPATPGAGARNARSLTHAASALDVLPVGPLRASLSAAVVYNLVGYAGFSAGTVTAAGWLWARRVR